MSKISRTICCLVFLAGVALLAASCSRNAYVIPKEATAKDQFTYALKMEEMYLSPFRKESKSEDYKRAMAAFRKVIKEFPKEKEARALSELHIAFMKDKDGQTREALREYESLLKRYPENESIQINALYGAAVNQDRLKHFEKAKAYYQQILERYGQRTDGNYPEIVNQARIRYLRPNKK